MFHIQSCPRHTGDNGLVEARVVRAGAGVEAEVVGFLGIGTVGTSVKVIIAGNSSRICHRS